MIALTGLPIGYRVIVVLSGIPIGNYCFSYRKLLVGKVYYLPLITTMQNLHKHVKFKLHMFSKWDFN